MTYKEFLAWCNDRAMDGCWGMHTAMTCIDIIHDLQEQPFWRRKKVWEEKYKDDVLDQIVIPIDKKIESMKKMYKSDCEMEIRIVRDED